MQKINFSKIERMAANQGIELGELAIRMGYRSPASLYNIRKRAEVSRRKATVEVRNKVAKRIADYFGVSVDEIAA